MEAEAVWSTALAGLPPPRRGKVRDVYDLGETLLLVASDRLSAYDHVLRPGIPGKGKVLTQLSSFWFERLGGIVPHHLLATDPRDFPAAGKIWRLSLSDECTFFGQFYLLVANCCVFSMGQIATVSRKQPESKIDFQIAPLSGRPHHYFGTRPGASWDRSGPRVKEHPASREKNYRLAHRSIGHHKLGIF